MTTKSTKSTKPATKSTKSTKTSKLSLERQIEQAAARGDRELLEKLTAAPKAKRAQFRADNIVRDAAAVKALRAAKAPKAVSASAIDADDALDAANNAKAPKGNGLRAMYLQWLAKTAKESSVSYANSMRRPVGAFVDWCAAKGLTVSKLDTGALERYRAHVEKQGNALSTQRMSLARVQTFCRFVDVGADLKVLRIQHTKAEKKHLTSLATERAEVAA